MDKVLGFFSSRPNWDPPLTRRRVNPPPPFGSGGGTHSHAGEVVGDNSDEGTDTVVLLVQYILYVLCDLDDIDFIYKDNLRR